MNINEMIPRLTEHGTIILDGTFYHLTPYDHIGLDAELKAVIPTAEITMRGALPEEDENGALPPEIEGYMCHLHVPDGTLQDVIDSLMAVIGDHDPAKTLIVTPSNADSVAQLRREWQAIQEAQQQLQARLDALDSATKV